MLRIRPMSRRERFVLWVSELGYWHVTRHTRKFYPWVARKLPWKVRYWVVVNAAASVKEPESGDHRTITWVDMVDTLVEERD